MNRGKAAIFIVILLAAAACGSTPTPVTAAVSTIEPPTALAPTSGRASPVPSEPPAATATAGAAASPTPASPSSAPIPTVAAGQVVKLAGNSYITSDPFRLTADTTLDVSWNYTGTAPFALWLVNVSENLTDPNYDRILVDDVTGPHTGTRQEKVIAGDWTVQVEQATGPWTVEFKPES